MIKVILDTNFLIYCAKEKLDYPEEISKILNEKFVLVVPRQVINELIKLSQDKLKKVSGKDKNACFLALQLLKFYNIEIIELDERSVDLAIIKLAKENEKNIVATLDREMRYKLGRVILINSRRKLMLTK